MPNTSGIAESFKKHPLYDEFIQVKNKLRAGGFVCWIAGGAVRDLIIGRVVADFDLATDATTEQLIKLFPEAIMVGAQFGVIKLHFPSGTLFDLATFRRESDYTDGRRPSKVDYATPAEDAQRRDFTINAMYWDDETQSIVDFEGGLNDIENKKIRCVGVPAVRFQEDYLRILRLLRFSVQLQFSIEDETLHAAISRVKSLEKISGERIWSELVKMSESIRWEKFFSTELSKIIFKSLFPIEIADSVPILVERQLHLSDQCPGLGVIKLFYFLLIFSKSDEVLIKLLKNRLRISKSEIEIFLALQFVIKNKDKFTIYEWMYEIEKKPVLAEIIRFFHAIQLKNDYLALEQKFQTRPDKLIDGHDLKGVVSPVEMASVLKKIRLLQFEQPLLTKSEILEILNQNKIIST